MARKTKPASDLAYLCRELKALSLARPSSAWPHGTAPTRGPTRSYWPPAWRGRWPPARPTAASCASGAARFPARKTLEEFDFDHQRSLRRDVVAHLGALDFVAARENVVFLGPPGCRSRAGMRCRTALCGSGAAGLGSESLMDERTVVVQGIPTRWQEHGDGYPVVLIHGIPTSPTLWRHVAPGISGRALAWEMTGYGRSIAEGAGRDISMARQADHLLAWLDELRLDGVVLVGHDLGGGVAQIAATRARNRVAGLVLTNAIAYDSWPIPSVKAMRTLGPLVARAPSAAFRATVATLMYRGHDDRNRASESLGLHVRPYLEHGDAAAAMVRQVQALDVNDTVAVQDQLPSLRIPCRIVWGVADQFQRIRYGERLAADLRAPLQRIEGGKHFTPEDHPQALVDAINSLLVEVASVS